MISVLVTAATAVCLMALAALLYRSITAGAVVIVSTTLVTAVALDQVSVVLMGWNLTLEDLACGMLLLVAAWRFLVLPGNRGQVLRWAPFAAATALAFVWGASLYGVKAAGVEYRGFFSLCATVVYCASFALSGKQITQVLGIWVGGAVALLALAAFRWVALLLHLDVVGTVAGELKPWRVLNASQTLYLAQALIIVAYWRRHARAAALMTWLMVALAAAVLLLQHRSVWVMTVAAIGFMAWREGFWGRFWKVAVTVGVLIVLAYPALSTMGGGQADLAGSFRASVEEPLDMEQSTFGWRVAMWGEYLAEFAEMTPVRMLLGAGLGKPSTYFILGEEVERSAHNFFVFVLNRAGILGLLSLLGCYGLLVRELRRGGVRWDYLGLFLTIASGQLVYYMVYSPAQDQGLLIGSALAAAFGRRALHAA